MTIIGNFAYDIVDSRTGEPIVYKKVTSGYDGTTITTSNEADYIDGVLYVKFSNGTYWRRVAEDGLNVRWFGVVGDGSTDDYSAFHEALRVGALVNIEVIIPNGVDISLNGKVLSIPSGITLVFRGGFISNGTLVGNRTAINTGL